MLRSCLTSSKLAEKFGPEAVTELNHAMTTMKADYYKAHGVKTPIELVKAMAEFETNVYGSKMVVFGDDQHATVEYEVCGCYNAIVNTLKLGQTEQEAMGKKWSASVEALAKQFNFKSEVKFGTCATEPKSTITFTK